MPEIIKSNHEEAIHELRYKEIANKTFEVEVVQGYISQLHDNAIQNRKTKVPYEVLEVFREITSLIVKKTLISASYNINNIGRPGWKRDFANAISSSIYDYYKKDDEFQTKVAILKEVLKKYVKEGGSSESINLGIELGMPKVVSAIAQTSFLIEAQINPDIILLSDEEAQRKIIDLSIKLKEKGDNVITVDPDSDADELIEKLKFREKSKDTLH